MSKSFFGATNFFRIPLHLFLSSWIFFFPLSDLNNRFILQQLTRIAQEIYTCSQKHIPISVCWHSQSFENIHFVKITHMSEAAFLFFYITFPFYYILYTQNSIVCFLCLHLFKYLPFSLFFLEISFAFLQFTLYSFTTK